MFDTSIIFVLRGSILWLIHLFGYILIIKFPSQMFAEGNEFININCINKNFTHGKSSCSSYLKWVIK